MTTPSLSWIDRSRWSALLENATPTPPGVAAAKPRAPAIAKKPAAPAPRPAPVVALPQAAAYIPVPPLPPVPAPAASVAAPEAYAPLPPPVPEPSPTTTRAADPPPPRAAAPAAEIDTAAPISASAAVPPSQMLPLAFEPPHAELEERLQSFFEWVIRSVPCTAAFIADEHGLPLIQRGAMPDHIAFSSSVLTLLESLEGLPRRWLSIGIARDTILHLAEVSTVWGRFGVGIVAGDSLRKDVLAIVQQGLERAFEE